MNKNILVRKFTFNVKEKKLGLQLCLYELATGILHANKNSSVSDLKLQSNSVITNSSGPAKFVCYNRGSL